LLGDILCMVGFFTSNLYTAVSASIARFSIYSLGLQCKL
jgi:hypothetical protein